MLGEVGAMLGRGWCKFRLGSVSSGFFSQHLDILSEGEKTIWREVRSGFLDIG